MTKKLFNLTSHLFSELTKVERYQKDKQRGVTILGSYTPLKPSRCGHGCCKEDDFMIHGVYSTPQLAAEAALIKFAALDGTETYNEEGHWNGTTRIPQLLGSVMEA